VGSDLGIAREKIEALPDYASSAHYDPAERIALEYADAITLSDRDVGDDLFAKLKQFFEEDAIVELTAIIAWENASSKFNRALRVSSQNLWQRR
jgi:alkylhydroperoxidase family enzyme